MTLYVLQTIRQIYAIDCEKLFRVREGDVVVISLLGLRAPQAKHWTKAISSNFNCLVFAAYNLSTLGFAAVGFNCGREIVDQRECTQEEGCQTVLCAGYKIAIWLGCPSLEFQQYILGDFNFVIVFGLLFSRTPEISQKYDVDSLLHSMTSIKPCVATLPLKAIHVVFANPIGTEGIRRYPGTSAVLTIQHGNIYALGILSKSEINLLSVDFDHRKWLLEHKKDGALEVIDFEQFLVECTKKKKENRIGLSLFRSPSPETFLDSSKTPPDVDVDENRIDVSLPRTHRYCNCKPLSPETFVGASTIPPDVDENSSNARPSSRSQSPKRCMGSSITRSENSNGPFDTPNIEEPSEEHPNLSLSPLLNIPLSPF